MPALENQPDTFFWPWKINLTPFSGLAALEAETNPAKAMDLIQRYYVNPINNRRHPLKHVRWTKALDPYKPKNRTAAAANPPSSKP